MSEKDCHVIKSIVPGSIADELGIEPLDVLISINDQEVKDVFDYHYLCNEEYLTVVIEKPDGEQWELEIEKEYEDDLGIGFENGLMDNYRSCCNKCIFCFIDQMPKGMRDTLYFKDDDSRLSFLQGNYITLTNMSEYDVERIIQYKMEPINISVHTTNPELRNKMLNNRFAGQALKKMQCFADAGITMNGQIVLCKGYNDREELDRTISDLVKLYPSMQSVSVVPVGLTKYREGLAKLEPLTKEDAANALEIIEKWQKKMLKTKNTHFVHASDEFYLLAERELPEEDNYDGYPQLENGVGMLRVLRNEFLEELDRVKADSKLKRTALIATGKLAAPTLKMLMEKMKEKFPGVDVEVRVIRNDFFGEMITVSGLITGQDLVKQLKGNVEQEFVAIPCNMLRSGEEVFLDDMTLSEVSKEIEKPIKVSSSSAADLLHLFID